LSGASSDFEGVWVLSRSIDITGQRLLATIVLTVSPSLNAEGRKAYSTRGQLFDGKVDGRCIVERSTTPLCDAARVLFAEGVDPGTRIVMHHANSPHDALRSTIGAAAKLTVVDDRGGKPIFAKWSPYEARRSTMVGPPMRETDSAAVLVPDAPELAREAVP
jgi:hypothetical protein